MNNTAIKAGIEYEATVQRILKENNKGVTFNNIWVTKMYEFDTIIIDHPTLTLIQIKNYSIRSDPTNIRGHIIKLKNACNTLKDSPTHQAILFNKLNIAKSNKWNFQMMVIVPDTSYERVMSSLHGDHLIRKTAGDLISAEHMNISIHKDSTIATGAYNTIIATGTYNTFNIQKEPADILTANADRCRYYHKAPLETRMYCPYCGIVIRPVTRPHPTCGSLPAVYN